jgi:tripartite-type tricarboxylate transporter receptor subunit TctC
MSKKGFFVLALLSMVLLLPQFVLADNYPSKPVEIICPYSAGSSFDITARLFADIGAKHLGQPIVVTNKTGAAGGIAAADVLSSRPDGYKIIEMGQDFFGATIYTQKYPFDPNNLEPLANFAGMKMGLGVRADSPIKTFKDFIAELRKNPGKLRWSHTARGTPPQLAVMAVLKKEKLTALEVPFKGTPEVTTALLGGHTDVASIVYGAVADLVKAGKIRFIVLWDDKRFKDFPDVPTAAEAGFPEASMPGLIGLYIHKDTPDHIKKKLLEVCKKVYDDPKFKVGVERINLEPTWGDPDFVRAAIKRSYDLEIPLIKELGLYVGK